MEERRKNTVKAKVEDAKEIAELLEQLSRKDKEKIRYVMIGLQMGEAARAGKTA